MYCFVNFGYDLLMSLSIMFPIIYIIALKNVLNGTNFIMWSSLQEKRQLFNKDLIILPLNNFHLHFQKMLHVCRRDNWIHQTKHIVFLPQNLSSAAIWLLMVLFIAGFCSEPPLFCSLKPPKGTPHPIIPRRTTLAAYWAIPTARSTLVQQ